MEQWYKRTISGEAAGLIPAVVRAVLTIASWPYGLAMRARNWAYDAGRIRVVRLPVPVISVGNMTIGGTGKTPTVIMMVRDLVAMGRKPAVLTRGYGAVGGALADEVQVIQRECPGVPVVVNGDRVAGGQEAISKFGADVLVLDDGFQHRRLYRDVNIVLVDATNPMGVPGIIPRGSWREPPRAMARATHIMLTRCEQVAPELVELAAGLLAQWVKPRNIFEQRTRVIGVFDATGRPVVANGQHVLVFAGVGNPEGFLNTVRSTGLIPSSGCWFDDHHNYHRDVDFQRMHELTAARSLDAWVTTVKDWVKIKDFKTPVPIWHVRIESRIEGVQSSLWHGVLAAAIAGR